MDEVLVKWVNEHQEFLENLKLEGFLKPDLIKTIDQALREKIEN